MASSLDFGQLKVARRTRSGTSAPQGADGLSAALAEALAAMDAAAWEASASGPFTPVHDYAPATPPAGDCYRATWGYNAAARTERAALGMVVYSFAIPASASGSLPSCVVFDVCGDRYVAANYGAGDTPPPTGVSAAILATGSATPPAPSAFDAATGTAVATGLCIPEDRAKAPNNRAGVTESVTLVPAAASGATHIHILLRMEDYSEHRGAWIEGGAMLVAASFAATWDSDGVTGDGPDTVALLEPAEGGGSPVMLSPPRLFRTYSLLASPDTVRGAIAAAYEPFAGADGAEEKWHASFADGNAGGAGWNIFPAGHTAGDDGFPLYTFWGEDGPDYRPPSQDSSALERPCSAGVYGSIHYRFAPALDHVGRTVAAVSFSGAITAPATVIWRICVWYAAEIGLFARVPGHHAIGTDRYGTPLADYGRIPRDIAVSSPVVRALWLGESGEATLAVFQDFETDDDGQTVTRRLERSQPLRLVARRDIAGGTSAGFAVPLDSRLTLGRAAFVVVTMAPVAYTGTGGEDVLATSGGPGAMSLVLED